MQKYFDSYLNWVKIYSPHFLNVVCVQYLCLYSTLMPLSRLGIDLTNEHWHSTSYDVIRYLHTALQEGVIVQGLISEYILLN
jgi:hypothetical protein